jgi:8-oxo-dGTP pyrophosphatase MutT (NUDIX family)
MIPKWETISESEINNLKIFKAEIVRRRHPIWGREAEFVRLNSKNWANVVPVTKDNEILLIEQYRQGSDSITLEVPGGLIEVDENPIDAAKRECEEETGYTSSDELFPLGICLPNPAFLNNQCYSYAWFGLEKKLAQNFDQNEEIRVIPTPISEVKKMIDTGEINHSIIVTALHYFFNKYKF